MKKSLGIFGAVTISASLITGCGGGTDQSDVSNAMVDAVVLPSYSKLASASKELNQALQNLVNKPAQVNLQSEFLGLVEQSKLLKLVHLLT